MNIQSQNSEFTTDLQREEISGQTTQEVYICQIGTKDNEGDKKISNQPQSLVCYDISSGSEDEMEFYDTVEVKIEPPDSPLGTKETSQSEISISPNLEVYNINPEVDSNSDINMTKHCLDNVDHNCDILQEDNYSEKLLEVVPVENLYQTPEKNLYCDKNVNSEIIIIDINPDLKTLGSNSFINNSSTKKQISDSKLISHNATDIQVVGDYRENQNEIILTSDSDSSSEDESESSSSVESCSLSEDEENEIPIKILPIKPQFSKKSKDPFLREIDLPPIEELQISVEEKETKPIGYIYQIVETQVVVQGYPNIAAIDIDSILFLECGKKTLGKVFDVFGNIQEPLYVVRFNTNEDITQRQIEKGTLVYFAPQTEHTSYVIVDELLKNRGSDASWKDNREPPIHRIDFSDDEEERRAKQLWRESKKSQNPEVKIEFESGSKRIKNTNENNTNSNYRKKSWMKNSNRFNRNFEFGGAPQFNSQPLTSELRSTPTPSWNVGGCQQFYTPAAEPSTSLNNYNSSFSNGTFSNSPSPVYTGQPRPPLLPSSWPLTTNTPPPSMEQPMISNWLPPLNLPSPRMPLDPHNFRPPSFQPQWTPQPPSTPPNIPLLPPQEMPHRFPSPQESPHRFPPPQESPYRFHPTQESPHRFPPPQESPYRFHPNQESPHRFLPPQGEPHRFIPPQGAPHRFPSPQEAPHRFPSPQEMPHRFPPPQEIPHRFPPPQEIPQRFLPPQEIPHRFPPPQESLHRFPPPLVNPPQQPFYQP